MCQPIWKEYAHTRFSEQFFDNGPEISKKSDANFLKKYWKSQMESIILSFVRGCSLAGKALASQVKDRGFESRHLHWKTGSSPVRVLPVFSVSICFFYLFFYLFLFLTIRFCCFCFSVLFSRCFTDFFRHYFAGNPVSRLRTESTCFHPFRRKP